MPTTRPATAAANARPDPGLVAPARRVAFEILRRVDEGAHSTDLLRDRTPHLDPRDRALASELVLGVLRYQSQLDHLIQHFAGRELSLVPDLARALRLGVYQLRYLDRIPPHAAVDEAVELARLSSEAAAGLCNAVLRKVTREPVKWPDRATTLSMPTWLLRRWDDQFGKEAATKAAESFLEVPKTYIRVPQGPDGAMEPPPGAVATEVKGCYLIENGETSGYRFQDISSQAVVGLLDLKPGQTFADLAAAPGGKYLQAMETPGLLGIAADANYQRATQLPGHNRVVADATRALPFAKPFDRILLDAPCSGTGTIGRNPEIRWRIQPGDLTRYHERQVKMLTEALKMLAKGGRLVYSTCSLEPEENEQVIRRVAADFERVKIGETMHRLPGREAGDGFFAAVLTTR